MTLRRMIYVLQRSPGIAPVFVIGLAVSVALGSWWTSRAVISGDLATMFTRLAVSIVAALYYYVLLQICRGHELKIGNN